MSRLSWDPLLPTESLLVAGALALTVLVWMELYRKSRFRRWKLLAHAIMVVSLICIMVDLKFNADGRSNDLILLTPNYDVKQADSLGRTKGKQGFIRTHDAAPYPNSTLVTEGELVGASQNIRFILGDGVPDFIIDQFRRHDYEFIVNQLPEGIIVLDFPGKYYDQRWNKLTGIYHSNDRQTISLKLKSPDGSVQDSVMITGMGETEFSLNFFPKVSGKSNWQVVECDSSNTEVRSSELFIDILPERKLSIVILTGYPTFELRYLKNYLSNKGHQLAVKNTISKDRSRLEFINRSSADLNSINQELLESLDLVIIDAPSLNEMSSREFETLQRTIEAGLGVIILPTGGAELKGNSKVLINFKPINRQADTVTFSLARQGEFQLPASALSISERLSPVLLSKGDHVLAGYKLHGVGKIGFQLLNETYRLGLESRAETYALIWAPLLESVAREATSLNEFRITTLFPWYVNEPIDFEIISMDDSPIAKMDHERLPLQEDHLIDQVWTGTVWMKDNQWHDLEVDSTYMNIHLPRESDWVPMRTHNRIRATQGRGKVNSSSVSSTVVEMELKSLKLFFFVLFMLAGGLLWLSPKL